MSELLSSFDRAVRMSELRRLSAGLTSAERPVVNTHFHTFYSFNIEGWSPCRVAYEAKKAGLEVAGTVDFDVLDAMDEFFAAGDILGLRTIAALESRVYVRDMAAVEINSPGEPGVAYFMGTGFVRLPAAGSAAAQTLQAMRESAAARNKEMLARIRPALAGLPIDYDRDIAPLTPAGNVTERHMLAALDAKAREVYPSPQAQADYWAGVLGTPPAEAAALLPDTAKFRNQIRAKLMKKGGPGYVMPDETTFPAVEQVISMIKDSGAIPCWAWLNGMSAGEADPRALCAYARKIGCAAISIIPDRNWNVADPAARAKLVAAFDALVAAATQEGLVFTVGTEMNNYGQPFVDDFAAPEMQKHAQAFRDGAYALYGHTLMERANGRGLLSAWSVERFGADQQKRNAFYAEIGRSGKLPA